MKKYLIGLVVIVLLGGAVAAGFLSSGGDLQGSFRNQMNIGNNNSNFVTNDDDDDAGPVLPDYTNGVSVVDYTASGVYFPGKIDHTLFNLAFATNVNIGQIDVNNFVLHFESISTDSAFFYPDQSGKIFNLRMMQDPNPTNARADDFVLKGNAKEFKLSNCGAVDCEVENEFRYTKKLKLLPGVNNIVQFKVDYGNVEVGDTFTITLDPSLLKFYDANGDRLDTNDVLTDTSPVVRQHTVY